MGKRLPLPEFVALIALLFSLIAYGTDAMLPALELMAGDLGTDTVTEVQLVIVTFILGTGVGQLLAGPLSDAIGRKPVMIGGITLFILASLLAAWTSSLEWLLVARLIQGLGISAPRTVGMAMVRDLYEGRQMASVISLAMTVFMIVPAVAPLVGQGLMLTFGWRSIFISFIVIGVIATAWLSLRQAETHVPEKRRPLRLITYSSGLAEVLGNRRTLTCICALSLVYAFIFSYLTSAQQVFVDWLGTGTKFPAYFAVIAIVSASASALNAYLVLRIGMWRLSAIGIALVAVTSLTLGTALFYGFAKDQELILFMIWSCALFFLSGLIFANLNALAMEPMGHIAGIAAALVGAISTIGSILVATPIGQAYNGTGIPLMLGVGFAATAAFVITLAIPRSV